MNFLAHIYLSGDHEEILVGNFMGDYVKGREYLNFPEQVSRGIMLHRKIDFFTDQHPVTRKSRNHIIQYYRKYSGIVIDILYDYLLARNWETYCDVPLPHFVNNVFLLLKKHYEILPQGIKNWFPNFIRNNWLMSYSTLGGVETVLHRMSSRTTLPEFTDAAIKIFEEKSEEFNQEFNEFFPDIRKWVKDNYGIESGCMRNFTVY
jgi:acyl carrier protein phosphodiesterase